MDFLKIMRQAQDMQARMEAARRELDETIVEGASGGGMVRITLSAKGELRAIAIDPALVKAEEKDILEDLIVAAHADAKRKAEALVEERMRALTAGLPLPPGFKLPF